MTELIELGAKQVNPAEIFYVGIERTGVDILLYSGKRIKASPNEWDAAMRHFQIQGTEGQQARARTANQSS